VPEDIGPVQWAGHQAVVTLPEHIDRSNASRVSDQLLWVINRGAAVLIADMTATLSCDYSGADALVRAYRRAVANGIQMRLVVNTKVVRRLLSINGLDRLVSVYPSLDGALAAVAGHPEAQGEPAASPAAPAAADPGVLGQVTAADRPGRVEVLLDSVVNHIFNVGVALQSAADLPHEAAGQRITDALGHLDDVVREIRDHVFTERALGNGRGRSQISPLGAREAVAPSGQRAALLQARLAQTARALRFAAEVTATLLEQQANLPRQPTRVDYPAEVKRWRALADQADQMAQRWKEQPD
jgi:anti-sigma B factor antagonist